MATTSRPRWNYMVYGTTVEAVKLALVRNFATRLLGPTGRCKPRGGFIGDESFREEHAAFARLGCGIGVMRQRNLARNHPANVVWSIANKARVVIP